MTPEIIEKLTLVGALVVAVVYLWRAYQAAIDKTIAELKEELKRCDDQKPTEP